MSSETPLFCYDNVFDAVQLHSGATLSASSETAGHEARRVADYRRDRTDWTPADAGTVPNRVMLAITPGALGAVTASRASTATYFDSNGILQTAAANVVRDAHYEQGVRTILLEGSRTNLTQRGYLFGANGTNGWTTAGDAAGVLSVVDDSAALAAAGLSALVTDGKVLKLDNSAGTTPFNAQSTGGNATTNPHSVSAFVRGGTGNVNWANLPASKAIFGVTGAYTRVVNRGFTPTATGGTLRVCANPGQVVYFVLPQLEEGAFESSPIPNSTAASATRAPDLIGWTIPDAPHAMEWVVEFEEHGAATANSLGIASLGNDAQTGARLFIAANPVALYYHNGTSQIMAGTGAAAPAIGQRVTLRARLSVGTHADGTQWASVQLWQSINGAAETTSGPSAEIALAPAWGGQTFRLNSRGAANQGNAAYPSATLTDTSPDGNWIRADLSAGDTVAPTFLWLDRGHNLAGRSVIVEGLTNGAVDFSATFTVPADGTVGGDPTSATLVGTVEGGAWGLIANAPARQQWRLRIPYVADFVPVVTGVMLGTACQFLGYSNVLDDDARARKMLTAESDAGYQASAPVYSWRTASLDMRLIGDSEYDGMVSRAADVIFNRAQPFVLCHNYGAHPERAWLFQYDSNSWSAQKQRTTRSVRIPAREVGARL